MSWTFIVCRNNMVETSKVFTYYFEGEKYTDQFLMDNFSVTKENLPKYRENESYNNQIVTVGLYKSCR